MTQIDYLEAEFCRYFPRAHMVAVARHDENIAVYVSLPDVFHPLLFTMAIGSDDDWYTFSNEAMTFTIPLEGEIE